MKYMNQHIGAHRQRWDYRTCVTRNDHEWIRLPQEDYEIKTIQHSRIKRTLPLICLVRNQGPQICQPSSHTLNLLHFLSNSQFNYRFSQKPKITHSAISLSSLFSPRKFLISLSDSSFSFASSLLDPRRWL